MSNIRMLFESGKAAIVKINLHDAHPGTGRPIDAYLITEGQGDVTTSARRGAEAAYAWCRRRNPQLSAAVVSYDLIGPGPNDSLSGGSGGLAFALALAMRLQPVAIRGDVAATGEILSGNDGGPIGPVAGIKSKLQAAVDLLPPGSLLFYPGDQENEISPELQATLRQRDIIPCPVTGVDQALTLLYADPPGHEPTAAPKPATNVSRRRRYLLPALLPLVLATAWSAQHYMRSPATRLPKPPVTVVDTTAESGVEIAPGQLAPQPVETAPARTDSSTQPVIQPPESGKTVVLKGNSELDRTLASQLERRLRNILPTDWHLDGEVAIVAMSEHEEGGRLFSSLTVALRHAALTGPEGRRTLPEQTATVSGYGPAIDRLPAAARQLAAPLLAPEKYAMPASGTGFD